jgi:hypothetical protein
MNIEKENSLIFVLFLFQYGLMFPFNLILGSQYPIMVFTALLLIYLILKNRIKFNLKIILLLFVPIIFLLFKIPFETNDSSGAHIGINYLSSFLTIGVSAILIGSLKFSHKNFFKYGYIICWINFLFFCFIPLTSYYGNEVNYMRFGYGILPTVIFSYVYMFQKKNFLSSMLLFIISFFLLLIFGARGAFLSFLFFFSAFTFLFSPIRKRFKLFLLLVLSIIILKIKSIIIFFISIVTGYNFNSYSLTKFVNYLDGNSFASTSSGRNEAYAKAVLDLTESPFFGLPLNTSYKSTGLIYYHNIFLDIGVNWGLIILFLFVLSLFFFIYKTIKTSNNSIQLVFLILFCLSITRLFVSSNYFERPEFWLLFSYCVSSNYTLKKNLIN